MPMYILKNNKIQLLIKNYNSIYDVKYKKLYCVIFVLILILTVSLSIPAPYDYLNSISSQFKLKSVDNIYDYYVPLTFSIIFIWVFFNDYETDTYKMIMFFNRNKFNYFMFYRCCLYLSIFCIGTFFTGMIYYRNISFLNFTNIALSIRFVPNIIFLSGIIILSFAFFKSGIVSILILSSYYCLDLTSSGNLFDLLSIGAHSNNFFYNIGELYYFTNRILILFLGLIFIFLACKRSSKL